MPAPGAGAGTRSLQSIAPGERACITTILFDRLRAECGQLGLRPGTKVRCRAGTPDWLILETEDGRRVRLERGWARFVEIEVVGTDTPARPAQLASA